LASLGASDEETLDGFHGSEKAYLRLFIKMAENDKILGFCGQDLKYLNERLNSSKGPFSVFGNDEF